MELSVARDSYPHMILVCKPRAPPFIAAL